jgi:hypothetical protein
MTMMEIMRFGRSLVLLLDSIPFTSDLPTLSRTTLPNAILLVCLWRYLQPRNWYFVHAPKQKTHDATLAHSSHIFAVVDAILPFS